MVCVPPSIVAADTLYEEGAWSVRVHDAAMQSESAGLSRHLLLLLPYEWRSFPSGVSCLSVLSM